MTNIKDDIRAMLWLGNFLCLGLCLAYWAGALFSGASPLTSQKSILLVLIVSPACVYGGARLWQILQTWTTPQRDFVWLASFIFSAGFANFVFSPGQIPFFTLALPFLAMAWAGWFTDSADNVEAITEGFVTMLCQAAALALVTRVFGLWWLCMAGGVLVCFAAYQIIGKNKPGLLTALLSPMMALWFFLSLSNQLVNSYPGWSRFILGVGAVVYVGLIGLGFFLFKGNSPGLKMFNRACLLVFAASLVMDINVEAGMSTPLYMLDFHWWIHVAPGLDAVYDTMRPYVHYIPFEGFIFETMMPRLWFVGLNQTMGGYFILMGLLCFASLVVYALLLYSLLRRVLDINNFSASLLACVLVITNTALLQIMYPFPGAWTIAERGIICFVCVAIFLRYYSHGKKPWLAALAGGMHAFSFFYEPLFGLACLVALAGTMLLLPKRIKNKLALIAGAAGVIAAFIIIFRIPLYMFFIHQPLAMVDSGGKLVDLGQGRNIFQAFFRDHALSVFHYANALGALLVFLGLVPTKARQHKFFGLALYLFIATFFMFISGGQRFFGEPAQTFSTIHFAAMASVLAIPLWICLFRIGLDVLIPNGVSRKTLAMACLVAAVLFGFTDGLYQGLAPGPARAGISGHRFQATAWDEQVHYQDAFSNSIPVILEYYYRCKSRQYVAEGPPPLAIHYMPYDKWKDRILPMPPVQDIRAFISHSRIKNDR